MKQLVAVDFAEGPIISAKMTGDSGQSYGYAKIYVRVHQGQEICP